MRFLHTADLHIGRVLNDVSLLEDQKEMLAEIVKIAAEKHVDAVLIAGDVYQKAAPQAEAMTVFDGFVSELCGKGIKLFAVSGNHDSAQRISYFGRIIKNSGVYVTEEFEGCLQRETLSDEFGPINIWMLPYIKPAQVRVRYPNAKINDYTDAINTVVAASGVNEDERNIILAHQYITGSKEAGSEERIVGTLENVDASAFEKFDYTALGHIHKPQKVQGEFIRYSGSPLKYSIDESSDKKGVLLIDIKQKGNVSVTPVPITQKHALRRVEGTLAEITDMPYSEDYVWITIKDEQPDVEARLKASVIFRNIMNFRVDNSKTGLDMEYANIQNPEKMNHIEMLRGFFARQNNGAQPSREQVELFDKLFNEEDDK